MIITLPTEFVDDLISAADEYGCEIRNDYSGRFMYGEMCFGITGHLNDILKVLNSLSNDHKELVDALTSAVKIDNMGLQMIYYFPGFQLEE